MKISAKGLNFIKKWEYFVPYVYDDLVKPRYVKGKGLVYKEYTGGKVLGTLTIGYGHTKAAKAQVDMSVGARLSEAEASRILDIDLDPCEAEVNKQVKVDLTQGQFDALTSFTFNCGEGAFRKSVILKKLNRGDYDGARLGFDLYVNAKGKRLQGLVNRRDGEQALWDTQKARLPRGEDPVDDVSVSSVDRPKPTKTMATSTEGMVNVGNGAVGATMAGDQVFDASKAVDHAIEVKEKAELLGVDLAPLTMWEIAGPFVTKLVHSPFFWLGVAMLGASAYGWYRRRQRLLEELS